MEIKEIFNKEKIFEDNKLTEKKSIDCTDITTDVIMQEYFEEIMK